MCLDIKKVISAIAITTYTWCCYIANGDNEFIEYEMQKKDLTDTPQNSYDAPCVILMDNESIGEKKIHNIIKNYVPFDKKTDDDTKNSQEWEVLQ